MEEFKLLFIILFGLTIGSFLNVLIYRLPLNISLVNPKRSTCPICNHTIKWYENIPLLSYIFLKGQCSSCNTSISITYPIVELITVITTYVLFNQLGLTLDFYFMSMIIYLLIVLSFIDLKYKAVPDLLLVIITAITLTYIILYNTQNMTSFFIFAGGIVIIELFVTFYIQNIKAVIIKDASLKEQKAIGEGDIPIIAIIGGILGVKFGIVAIFLSAVLAIIPSIINLVLKKEIETPFIPFLAMGFFIIYTNQNFIEKILQGMNIT